MRGGRCRTWSTYGRLVPAKRDDPLRERDAERDDGLGRDGELAEHLLDIALARQRLLLLRRQRAED
eukprot:4010620-Prymnesium_polylepis.1